MSDKSDDQALAEARQRIDTLDQQIQSLIAERAGVALDVAQIKQAQQRTDFYRPEREADVLRRVAERNEGPLDNATITRLVAEGGIVSPKGPAGSVILFHGNLVHGSPSNMSPFDRTIVYLSLCHVDNHIRQFKRPAWIAHRDFSPIEPLADGCLRELARTAETA